MLGGALPIDVDAWPSSHCMTPQRPSCLYLVAQLFLAQHLGMTADSAYRQDIQIRYTHTILMYSALSAATRTWS